MEPLISIQLANNQVNFRPGEVLVCDYQIDAVESEDVQAVEASVLWYTEGKGEEDMAVHYFERHVSPDSSDGDLRTLRRFETALPNSPLSYAGQIVRIHWCVRVRAFLRQGRECCGERPFQLATRP
jgi:hypothetical protein